MFFAMAALLLSLSVAPAFASGAHYNAKNCEVFVDKVGLIRGSHTFNQLVLFVKVLPQRLDSGLVEVGFRSQRDDRVYHSDYRHYDWNDQKLTNFPGASDYFVLTLPLSSDFGQSVHEGAFYVRTAMGTTYWLKQANGANFVFNPDIGRSLESTMQWGMAPYTPSGAHNAGKATQSGPWSYLNPSSCY
jgi:hypothetical protein